MRIFVGVFLWILLSLATLPYTSLLSAQSTVGNGVYNDLYNQQSQYGINVPDPNYGMGTQMDSLGSGKDKEKKIRKPLESYYFVDSIKQRNAFSWRHNPYNNNIDLIPIDTMLEGFQKDYFFFQQENVGVAYLGNLGGAAVPLNFYNRPQNTLFSFLDAYDMYLFTPSTARFFNAKRPFTQLSYFMSGQTLRAEEQLRVLHSQNISPSSSFNLDYRNNGTRGMYHNQRSKDKNLSIAFTHTGKRYSVHAGYIYNMGDIRENGGLFDDREVKDTLIDLPQNLTMNLRDARNIYKGNTFYITQSYGIPLVKVNEEENETLADVPAVFIGNSFEYTRYKKTYTDTRNETQDGFYQNWFINPYESCDSINQRLLDVRLFAQVQPYNRQGIFGTIDGGIGFRNEHYYYFTMAQYMTPSKGTVKNSVYVYANVSGQLKKYLSWGGHFKYTPIGYRNQDMTIGGDITLSAFIKDRPITLSADVQYDMRTPSYWAEQYFSNHYAWNNSFKKENETRFNVRLSVPSVGIEAGMSQSLINHKVYYNSESLPAQYGSALSVTGVYLQKDFRIAGLHLNNRVLLQWSSAQDVAPVPLVAANATYFYEFSIVKNVLRMQIGVDGYYNTSYYGFGYNPAIMQFYNQRQVKTGDYIWMDAFISGKWKRLRFLVKLQHFNYELFGGREYFQVAHYPLNRRMFKFGVSWNFYD